jgi:threonine dehydrogenase-like Zn-dependent dehydrogenase
MRALVWNSPNNLSVNTVPDPKILHPHDAIIQVRMTATCGSDLHLIDGYVPTMKAGDIIGHEFMGEIVETGSEVSNVKKGDRVVVPSPAACGSCYYCSHEETSLCDNTNPNASMQEKILGYPTSAVYGYSHAFGGFSGSHADYIRIPFADVNAFPVPKGLADEKVVFISDAVPTGYMGADLCNIQPGDIVAVWGCGGVGLSAIHGAFLKGAERVIAIDRFPDRLRMAQDHAKAEVLNYEEMNVLEALREMTAGRGPDACIECVGMEAHGTGLQYSYDRIKQALFFHTDRGQSVREALMACRKGGTVAIMGVFGVMDKFPLGIAMNKALTLKMGQQFGHKYIPILLEHARKGELDSSYMMTHTFSLEDAPQGYEIFKKKQDHCVRAVFIPGQKLKIAS